MATTAAAAWQSDQAGGRNAEGMMACRARGRVYKTGANQTGPVRPGSGLGRYQTDPNSKFKFEFKK